MKGVAKSKVVTSGRLTGKAKIQPTPKQLISNPRLAAIPEPAYSLDSQDQQVVTSGRLTGKAKIQPTPKQLIPNPRLAAIPEPAYSLDSQDQVTFLHKGLDQCAALLSGILHADKSDLPSNLAEVKDADVKSKLPTSLGKKITKKAPADRKMYDSPPHRPGGTTLRRKHHATVPAAHSGVKLHPTRKRFQTELSLPQTPHHTPSTSQHQTPSTSASRPNVVGKLGSEFQNMSCSAECACGGEDLIPVRDINPQSSLKVSIMQQERKQAEGVNRSCSVDGSSAEGEVKMQTVQYLLKELKALIIGEGSVAELLLRHLEQTMSSLVSFGNSSNHSEADVSLLQNQNCQPCRHGEVLQEQLMPREKAENKKAEKLRSSEACVMQEELNAALSQLQKLQENLTELQKAHQVTQHELRDKETINALIMSDLEATRCRLLVSEREKTELTTLCKQQLKGLEHLKGAPQSPISSGCTFVGSSVSNSQHQHKPDLSEAASERITCYLMSLTQPPSTPNSGPPLNSQTTVQQDGQPAENSGRCNLQLSQKFDMDKDLLHRRMSTSLSHCDVESVLCDWSTKSGSTFNTKDDAAFRDGLSALDSSIANLLKTIELDRGRSCI